MQPQPHSPLAQAFAAFFALLIAAIAEHAAEHPVLAPGMRASIRQLEKLARRLETLIAEWEAARQAEPAGTARPHPRPTIRRPPQAAPPPRASAFMRPRGAIARAPPRAPPGLSPAHPRAPPTPDLRPVHPRRSPGPPPDGSRPHVRAPHATRSGTTSGAPSGPSTTAASTP